MHTHRVAWSEYVFEGKLIKVRIDTVEIPEHGMREREIVEHPGAVAILPVLADGRFVLIRQFRPAVGQPLLEVPAGTREPDESPEDCARRELREETGYSGGTLRSMLGFFVSPGWCNERIDLYVAEGIDPGADAQEDDEQIEVELVDPDDIAGLIREGRIGDAKTVVALTTFLGLRISPQ